MATEVMTAPEGRIIHKTYAVLSGAAIPQRVHITQYDESLPVIACTLYKDGQLYTIPDGASVRMRMNKNGLPVYHEAMGIDDARHVVYLEITAQMTVLYGEFAMVIEVETSDGKTAGTSYLRLIVRQNPVQNPELDNIPDYTANSNRLTAEGVKKLQDESSTQQKAIEDKGKKTLESIPADYSTLIGKVDKNTSGISELKEDLDTLNQGGLNLKEDFIGQQVNEWLDEHPEATTTVQDHSLNIDKMVIGTLGYVTPEMFGAVGDGIADDSEAIEYAICTGLPVLFDNKTYLAKDIITKTCDNIILLGTGGTVIKWNITTTDGLRPNAGMISDDDYVNTAYKDGGIVIIKGITFDGNANNITAYPVTNALGLLIFMARDKVVIDTCNFVNCHADGAYINGVKRSVIVTNCSFEDIGQTQPEDGTRNGLTIGRNYYDRKTESTITNSNDLIVDIENCVFYNIADECMRVDGISCLNVSNCCAKKIGQHFIESGHSSDKHDNIVNITNCNGESIAQSIYSLGSDGGDKYNYKIKVNVNNCYFNDMCWDGCNANLKRTCGPFFINGYSPNFESAPDITVENTVIKSSTPKKNMLSGPYYFLCGGNVYLRNCEIDYAGYNFNSSFIEAFNGLAIENSKVSCSDYNSDFFIATNKKQSIKLNKSIFKTEKSVYNFMRCYSANDIRVESCIFDFSGLIVFQFTEAAISESKIYITESEFIGTLTGRCLNCEAENKTSTALYVSGNIIPSNYCGWGNLSNFRGSSLNKIVYNSNYNS